MEQITASQKQYQKWDSKEGFSLLSVFGDDKRSVKNLTIVGSGLRPEAEPTLEPKKVPKLEPE